MDKESDAMEDLLFKIDQTKTEAAGNGGDVVGETSVFMLKLELKVESHSVKKLRSRRIK